MKVLEDTNIKVASVLTDLFGVSGRRILAALIAGERDPQVLANLAVRRLRRKLPQLELALTGQFTEHHARLIELSLELIDLLDRQTVTLDQQIGVLIAPLTPQMEQLISIPGVEVTAARAILAEIGTDMSRFGSATRLASWAGVSAYAKLIWYFDPKSFRIFSKAFLRVFIHAYAAKGNHRYLICRHKISIRFSSGL